MSVSEAQVLFWGVNIIQWFHYSLRQSCLSSFKVRFAKLPAEPFPALPGTIPVEGKNVHWLSVRAAGKSGLRRVFLHGRILGDQRFLQRKWFDWWEGGGARLCFYTCLSFCSRRGGGLYPSMQWGRGCVPACNGAGVCVSQHAIGQEVTGGMGLGVVTGGCDQGLCFLSLSPLTVSRSSFTLSGSEIECRINFAFQIGFMPIFSLNWSRQ